MKRFVGTFLRLRQADKSKQNAPNADPKIIVNFTKDSEFGVRGTGLPMYNDLFFGILHAFLKGLTPEAVMITPVNAGMVDQILAKKFQR